jgi:hypothetical protein
MVYQRCGQIPSISFMCYLVQSARPLLHSNIFCGLPRMHVGLIFCFSSRPCVRLYLCSLMHTSKGLLVSPMQPLPVTWDAVHILLRLLGMSNLSSFHQCPTECMFSFENDPEIEFIHSASEFLGNTLNVWEWRCRGILNLKKDDCLLMA